jgi:hypothetical protein
VSAPLSIADRNRLEKIIGMLGSAFEPERLVALSKIQNIADEYKVPIHELLLGASGVGQGSSYDRHQAAEAERRAHVAERRAREAELRAQRAEQAAREAKNTRPAEPEPDAPKLPFDWRQRFAKAQEINQSHCFLTSWETTFVDDVLARRTRSPSPKQAIVIIRILEKTHTFNTASTDADWEDVP